MRLQLKHLSQAIILARDANLRDLYTNFMKCIKCLKTVRGE